MCSYPEDSPGTGHRAPRGQVPGCPSLSPPQQPVQGMVQAPCSLLGRGTYGA